MNTPYLIKQNDNLHDFINNCDWIDSCLTQSLMEILCKDSDNNTTIENYFNNFKGNDEEFINSLYQDFKSIIHINKKLTINETDFVLDDNNNEQKLWNDYCNFNRKRDRQSIIKDSINIKLNIINAYIKHARVTDYNDDCDDII